MKHANRLMLVILGAMLWWGGAALAKPGNAENGETIYAKRCTWCHGDEGDGLGAGEPRLNPPPRDFTAGTYKIKTSNRDEMQPTDDDIYRMIADGMPGTAMPGWSDVLKENEMWDLVAYLKTFAGYEESQPGKNVDYGTQVPMSEESIAKGKQLFEDGDRCVECHGKQGKGDAIKRLKGDAGERTWPRNLTKPWTFRGSNDPKDIFARISIGIPGTEMPNFADESSKKVLTIEERWHVANYVVSLAKTDKAVRPENTVVKAGKVEGDLPQTPDDERWEQAEPTTFFMLPQFIGGERLYKYSNDTITVRAMYNDSTVALLLEWDDRTKSIPGDQRAEKIGDSPISEDGVAVQLPIEIPTEMEKPYFGMGDASHPVNIWQWKSGTTETTESVALANSTGFQSIEKRDAGEVSLQGSSVYQDGTWRVVMHRPLVTSDAEKDLQFVEGKFIPVAFAAWDGSNSENGSRHTITTCYWVLLKPSTGSQPFILALLVIGAIGGGQFWWVRTAGRKSAEG